MKAKLILLFVIFIVTGNLFSQNSTMWLMNGKKITIKNYSIKDAGDGDTLLMYTSVKGKSKKMYFDEVFSVAKPDGSEEIIYSQNIEMGEVYTKEQMKSFIHGMYDAKDIRISPFFSLSSFAIGYGSAFIPGIPVSSGAEIPIGITVPATNAILMSALAVPDEKLKTAFPNKLDDEFYLLGCEETIQKKRLRNSIIGGLIGFTAGFITVVAIN